MSAEQKTSEPNQSEISVTEITEVSSDVGEDLDTEEDSDTEREVNNLTDQSKGPNGSVIKKRYSRHFVDESGSNILQRHDADSPQHSDSESLISVNLGSEDNAPSFQYNKKEEFEDNSSSPQSSDEERRRRAANQKRRKPSHTVTVLKLKDQDFFEAHSPKPKAFNAEEKSSPEISPIISETVTLNRKQQGTNFFAKHKKQIIKIAVIGGSLILGGGICVGLCFAFPPVAPFALLFLAFGVKVSLGSVALGFANAGIAFVIGAGATGAGMGIGIGSIKILQLLINYCLPHKEIKSEVFSVVKETGKQQTKSTYAIVIGKDAQNNINVPQPLKSDTKKGKTPLPTKKSNLSSTNSFEKFKKSSSVSRIDEALGVVSSPQTQPFDEAESSAWSLRDWLPKQLNNRKRGELPNGGTFGKTSRSFVPNFGGNKGEASPT